MFSINRKEFEERNKHDYALVGVSAELPILPQLLLANLYKELATPCSALLESQGYKNGQSSIIALGGSTVLQAKKYQMTHWNEGNIVARAVTRNPLRFAREVMQQYKNTYTPENIRQISHFSGGFLGYLGFEAVGYYANQLKAGFLKPDPVGLDDLFLWQTNQLIFIPKDSHASNRSMHLLLYTDTKNYIVARQKMEDFIDKVQQAQKRALAHSTAYSTQATQQKRTWKTEGLEQTGYKQAIKKIVNYIMQGDIMQAVPSHMHSSAFPAADVMNLYKALTRVSPSPYMYAMHLPNNTYIVGASPETLAQLKGEKMCLRPLAGTRKRGRTLEEDMRIEKNLMADEKERAEHLMLIDLARNDLGKIAAVGSTHVDKLMIVEKYAHIMHISSCVTATKKSQFDALDLIKVAHPAGTLSGAPKIRAIEIIQELEPIKRGLYGGAMVHLDFNGDLDSCIAIRTAVIKNDRIYLQSGAGIVADSKDSKEWEEVCNKKLAMHKAMDSL